VSFLETPRFPDNVSLGASGGPGYLTDIVTVNSGAESRNQNWTQARAAYEVSHAARLPTEYTVLRDFFRSVKGRTHGFRFKDHLDYTVTTANGVLGAGVGTGLPTYQLGKNYASGALTETRSISKPVSGTVAVYRGAVLQTAGSGAGQYALSTTTGIVTYVADATQTITSISCGATTVVNVTSALTGAASPKYVYLANIIGTAGAYLNGSAWQIASVLGTAITLTATANTTGLSATGGSGNAYMYPQASDALTWSGEFDVPCRFDTDQMRGTISNKSGGQYVVDWDSIPIVEIRV
jgi:uncharacterized protein (TIGR02217 family)